LCARKTIPQKKAMKNSINIGHLKPTMSAVELAKALGVGKNTIYAAVKAGRIPNVGMGKTVRIPTNWYVALMENWRVEDDSE
jgi:excisionase family DNA binding protein